MDKHFSRSIFTAVLMLQCQVSLAAPLWQDHSVYLPNDIVTFEGRDYKALEAHIADKTWVPSRSNKLWQDIGVASPMSNVQYPKMVEVRPIPLAGGGAISETKPQVQQQTTADTKNVPISTSLATTHTGEVSQATRVGVALTTGQVVGNRAINSAQPLSTVSNKNEVVVTVKCAAPWLAATQYSAGDIVSYDNKNYQAKTSNSNKRPNRISTNFLSVRFWKHRKDWKNWQELSACSNAVSSNPTSYGTTLTVVSPTATPSNTTTNTTTGPTPSSTPAPIIQPAVTASLAKTVSALDVAVGIGATHFSLDDASFNPSAVVLKGNVLYVANDQTAGSILRYDLVAQKALTPITTIPSGNGTQGFVRLSNLDQFQNRLYTASLSSNRIDVFDLSQGDPRFITSLGTGSWAGPSNQVLVHPMAVAANANYVFAADTHQRISVWKQSDVTPENNKQAIKHAYLSLPDCSSIYCDVELAAIGDRLYATFGNGKTAVYDVAKLDASTQLVEPIMVQSSVANTLALGDDDYVYVGRTWGGIDRYARARMPSQGIPLSSEQAIEQFSQFKPLGGANSTSMSKSKKISVNEQRIAIIQGKTVFVLPRKQVDELHLQTTATVNTYPYSALPVSQQGKILQDSDSWETLTDPSQRSFYINRILSGTMDDNQLTLLSYSALPVQNLELQARLKDGVQWFVLGYVDQLPAFSTTKLNLTVADGVAYPRVDGLGSVQMRGLAQLQSRPTDLFDIRITSKTDAHVQKLNGLKPRWFLYFGKYDADGTDASWGQINPIYAREWVIMMTNFAYALSSPEFEYLWFNHKKVMGHDFFGNAGQVDGTGGFFTAYDYSKYFAEIMNRSGISLGVTTMGGGLGGGNVLGVDTWNFYSHYFSNDGILGHEFGHHWGSHDSAWANSSYGLQKASGELQEYFLRKKMLPYTDPNINSFHLAPRSMLYNGIAEYLRKPRPDSQMNSLELYFQANPL